MNNLLDKMSITEKRAVVDKSIKSILDNYDIDWTEQILFSWNWTSLFEQLDPLNVYGERGVRFKNISTKKVSDDIASKFYFISEKSKYHGVKNDSFILELSVIIPGTTRADPYRIVVSNLCPDNTLITKYDLHPQVGKWNNGLR